MQRGILNALKILRTSAEAAHTGQPLHLDSPGFIRSVGLCGNLAFQLRDKNGYSLHLITHYAKTWPHHSGILHYPVPGPGFGGLVEADAVYRHTANKYEGVYGALRLDLLDHIIQQVEAGHEFS